MSNLTDSKRENSSHTQNCDEAQFRIEIAKEPKPNEVDATGISPQFWLLAIASGIMQYALAFLLYLTVLQSTPVSYAAFYIALIPIFGVASAIILLGEQPNLLQWIGAGLIVTSSYFANRLRAT